MDNIRCVIAGMPQQMLADIVQNTVEGSGLIEVVARVDGATDIASGVADHSADVLILGMQSSELPGKCTDVMKHIANLLVIGLVDDGRRLAVMVDNASNNDIPKIIQALRRSKPQTRINSDNG